jgi:hypothetical protein
MLTCQFRFDYRFWDFWVLRPLSLGTSESVLQGLISESFGFSSQIAFNSLYVRLYIKFLILLKNFSLLSCTLKHILTNSIYNFNILLSSKYENNCSQTYFVPTITATKHSNSTTPNVRGLPMQINTKINRNFFVYKFIS